jgi:hypothetical protein
MRINVLVFLLFLSGSSALCIALTGCPQTLPNDWLPTLSEIPTALEGDWTRFDMDGSWSKKEIYEFRGNTYKHYQFVDALPSYHEMNEWTGRFALSPTDVTESTGSITFYLVNQHWEAPGAGSEDRSTQEVFTCTYEINETDGATTFSINGDTPYMRSSGEGEGEDEGEGPYIINTIEELQAIKDNGVYQLADDIDASDTANWNGGKGFIPIGTFSGVLDGAGHTISNLYIYRPEMDYVGLFGVSSGKINNLGLIDCHVTGNNHVGSIAGMNSSGTLTNCYATGEIIRTGVVPYTGEVWRGVGGLVGYNNSGTMSDCWVMGSVTDTGEESSAVGGLLGENNYGEVSNCFAEGAVIGHGYVGGLVGKQHCFHTGINNCFTTATVTGIGRVGGVVGKLAGIIKGCYATGTVTGNGSSVGGLVGSASTRETGESIVSACYSTGAILGDGNVGGLVGFNGSSFYGDSLVTGCYATGTVMSTGQQADIGGLVGENEGIVAYSYAMSAVTGDSDGNAGGLVGYNCEGSLLTCYTTQTVTGDGDIGALVGEFRVSCTEDGFYCNGKMTGCFWDMETTGMVTSIGIIISGRGIDTVGLSTTEMMQQSAFENAGWDFTQIWSITPGSTYPWLRGLDYSETGYPAP